MDEFPQDYEVFDLGDVTLQHGATLRDAKLAYKTYGELNADKSMRARSPANNAERDRVPDLVLGASLGQRVADRRRHGPGSGQVLHHRPEHAGQRALELAVQYAAAYNAARFPDVTFYDQVEQQHKLVTSFGIETLPLVTGWSMGAGQTYQWAVSYPDMVQRACPFCGSSKTSEHNVVFLEGVKSALTADAAFKEGWYTETPVKGLRAAARVYAGWGFSQAFYWQQEYRKMG